MKNRIELRQYIRYQLSQLGARNAEHEFEQLCFELARVRQVPNLLPATGPVKAGGDQGRDFESYRTYLAGSPILRSSFTTRLNADFVVGACTLNKKTGPKISQDLETIFGGGEKPDQILYYCEPNVEVAKRHKLQKECLEKYGAKLEIFDGLAIADQLADTDTFWIAEQFLSVPADFFPENETDEEYASAKDKWLKSESEPFNYADFLQIKMGIRRATKNEALRPDLKGWIRAVRFFIGDDSTTRLAQKARYEIAVAELRGKGNLDPARHHVDRYFEVFKSGEVSADVILDAAVLAMYCLGTLRTSESTLSEDEVAHIFEALDSQLSPALKSSTRPGEKCTLLEARVFSRVFANRHLGHEIRAERLCQDWLSVLQQVRLVAYYPVGHIARIVETAAPMMVAAPSYQSLRDEIDRICQERAGSREVGERSLNRAIKHLEAGDHLSAIDELHRAKAGKFSGDELPLAVLIMLQLSNSYTALGLHIAARYYAAGATYMALNSSDEEVYALTPQAAFVLAHTFFDAGECASFILMLQQSFGLHLVLSPDPGNFDRHPDAARATAQAAVFRVIALQFVPNLAKLLDDELAALPFPDGEVEELMGIAKKSSPFVRMSKEEIENAFETELGFAPFRDLGPTRSVAWMALGIKWEVEFANEISVARIAFDLIGVLQIIQVELAQRDLLIIPTTVHLKIAKGKGRKASCNPVPGNDLMAWDVSIPDYGDDDESVNESVTTSMAVVSTVLGQATALKQEEFMRELERLFELGLSTRIFSIRSPRELMGFALAQLNEPERLRSISPPVLSREIILKEPKELAWRSGPGPGYSIEKAHEILRTRYRRSQEIIKLTLPRIIAHPLLNQRLRKMRADGVLDWQILNILSSIVCQTQLEMRLGRPFTYSPQLKQIMFQRMDREEREDDPIIDLDILLEDRLEQQYGVMLVSTLATWGLQNHSETPNIDGLIRLLNARYGNATDDIDHPDILEIPA